MQERNIEQVEYNSMRDFESEIGRLQGKYRQIDEKGSFFAILGDKGTIEPSDLIQSGTLDPRTSAI